MTTNSITYLKLSMYHWDEQEGSIFGPTLENQPSQQAKQSATSSQASAVHNQVNNPVTVDIDPWQSSTVVSLSLKTQPSGTSQFEVEFETVVLTVETGQALRQEFVQMNHYPLFA